jgi:hypothetical protein
MPSCGVLKGKLQLSILERSHFTNFATNIKVLGYAPLHPTYDKEVYKETLSAIAS